MSEDSYVSQLYRKGNQSINLKIIEEANTEKSQEEFEIESLLDLQVHLMDLGSKGVSLQRYKGLGEMNADQLKDTTMDPNQRRLLRVDSEDEGISSEMFSLLMGDQVEPRKAFIQKHAADVRNLDI